MISDTGNILVVNGGSSSIKFSVFDRKKIPSLILSGRISKVGSHSPSINYENKNTGEKHSQPVTASNMTEAIDILISLLDKTKEWDCLAAVGHRVVHGMEFTNPQLITDDLLNELQKIISYDPDHLPSEIEMIKVFKGKISSLKQVACFDTSFHNTIPRLARILAIPRKYDQQGIKRYGFHGLSYSFIMEKLKALGEPAAIKGRIILAHLGSGASAAAVLDGNCIDTSMGFTPAGGFMMGTRSGDLDPGLMAILMNKENMNATLINDFVNHQCGLLGVSETSADMQELLNEEQSDVRAAEAINLFCYQVKKCIGSFTTVLKGLDVLVFTGGIGENSAVVRGRICEGLEFMGIKIDHEMNDHCGDIISATHSQVVVYVIPTNEEMMIARLVNQVLIN